MEKNKTRAARRARTLRYQKRQIDAWLKDRSGLWALGRELSPQLKGHFRRHNPFDCGSPRCCMCRNVRRNAWYTGDARLTLSERRNLDTYYDQCQDENIPKDKVK